MEEKTNATVSADAIERKIAELRQAMKSADPAELENIKSIIRKNVSFFERMSFAAFLLMNASEGRRHDGDNRDGGYEKICVCEST